MLTKFLGTLSAFNFGLNAWAQMEMDITSLANDSQPGCEEQPFCDRFRSYMDHPDLIADSDVYYSINADSVTYEQAKGTINAQLTLASESDGSVAQTLDLTLNVYQNGILRMLLEEPAVKRFRISQEDLPVVEEQLHAQSIDFSWSDDKSSFTITDLDHDSALDSDLLKYTIELPKFRIN